MKRVLAFFGAFNPPTVAHVEQAQYALEQSGREGVVFVPSESAYIRNEQGKDFAFGDGERLAMLKAAAQSRPWMAVSDVELRAEAQPRTYDTLCRLRDEGYEPALLLGSDKLGELEHIWRHVEDIARQFGFVCMNRDGDDARRMIREDPYLSALAPWIQVIESQGRFQDVSSTRVRQKLTQIRQLQQEIAALVPAEVLPML